MATRTIKSAAGKSNLSVADVRTAARNASATTNGVASHTILTGASGAMSRKAAGTALAQRTAAGGISHNLARSDKTDADRQKRK